MAARIGRTSRRAIWREGAGAVTAMEASASDPARAFAIVGGGRGGGGGGAADAGCGAGAAHLSHGRLRQDLEDGIAGLPESAAHAVREDPVNRNLVFAALKMASSFPSMVATSGNRWN